MRAWCNAARALLAAGAVAFAGCVSFHSGPIEGTPKDATFVEVDGVRLHYVDEGKGPTVVLIHGFASSIGAWSPVRPALRENHRVIALDLKGFGYSDRPDGDYSPNAQAALILKLLDARGVTGPVTLVAHSWGSSIALALTLAAPERVSKIALYDAWVYSDQLPNFFLWSRADGLGEALIGAFYTERPDEKMASAFYDERFVTEELIETVEDQLSRPGTTGAALQAIRGQRFEEQEARYKTIDKPTLLLWGREDRVTTLSFGERLSKDLKNARLVVYPQCGHFPMIEAKAPSTRDLLAFIDEPVAAPAAALPVAASREPEPPAETEPPPIDPMVEATEEKQP